MVSNKVIEEKIYSDIEKLFNLLNYKNIYINQTKTIENKKTLSSFISEQFKNNLVKCYKNEKKEFKYIKKLNRNDFSTKDPYEISIDLSIKKVKTTVQVNVMATNSGGGSSPYMGSINKYINRLGQGHIYDMFFIVRYNCVDNNSEILEINQFFVKNIVNFSLYKNWQLQLNIKGIENVPYNNPEKSVKKFIYLLENMKTVTVEKIIEDCGRKIDILKSLKF